MNTLFKMLAKLAQGMGSRYRYKKTVKYPDSNQPTEILVKASPGSPSRPNKKGQHTNYGRIIDRGA